MDRPPNPPPGRVTAAFTGLAVAVTLGYVLGSAPVRNGLMLLTGLLAAVAIAVGLRRHRVTAQGPCRLAIIALALLSVTNTAWLVTSLTPGSGPPPDILVIPPLFGGYVFLLAASLAIVLRHAPRDTSGTLDAAVWGIALAAPVWEFLFRPRLLHLGVTLFGQFLVLTQLLVLLGICGSLLRVSRSSPGPARASLRFLYLALGFTILGIALVNLGNPAEKSQLPALLFAVGYLALGAAGLHPSVKHLSEPAVRAQPATPRFQLGRLGAALLLIPLSGGLAQLFGQPADGLLLTIAPLLSIPLVLIRIAKLRQALIHQATHDELTGLVNRRHLFTVMQTAIAAHADGSPGDLGLIYCDLNGFKPVNDEHGHEAGDAILRSTARRLAETVHPGDVVARIGGDEFLIFGTSTDPVSVRALADRVARAVAMPVTWSGRTLRVTAAIGTVTWTDRRVVPPDELLAAADARMYEHKRSRSDRAA
ncbi:GGDEF domain-containing protein [Actinoplanes sp. G11-F43]|uniref:GGDEF domain-containing protein n=1 Tax=Actinoplanes sp. G11-F43 TaxID=3424130 RepID=UPI003D348835